MGYKSKSKCSWDRATSEVLNGTTSDGGRIVDEVLQETKIMRVGCEETGLWYTSEETALFVRCEYQEIGESQD
jgi:hypothetical protein